MIVLAIDTAAELCAACIYDTQAGELGRHVLDLGKGHAEHLIGVIDEALAQAGKEYGDLDAIAVAVGPGSFTGVRVGVATARGLALALSIPAIGVTTLEALAAEAQAAYPSRPVIAAREAGRGQFHAMAIEADGGVACPPAAFAWEGEASFVIPPDAVLTGSAAKRLLDRAADGVLLHGEAATADIATYARLAVLRFAGEGAVDKPVPLYLREADAKPQSGFALPRRATEP